MSMELMVRAMKTKVGNPLRKLVLIKLADNASDQGECWPSYQHVADQCEIDRSTVRKHIKQLEAQGLLRIENRCRPKQPPCRPRKHRCRPTAYRGCRPR